MDSAPLDTRIRSLDRATVGEMVVVSCVLFDAVRTRLHDAGLGIGDRVRIRSSTPSHVSLATADGREIELERQAARFVQVSGDGRWLRYSSPARRFDA